MKTNRTLAMVVAIAAATGLLFATTMVTTFAN
jgi:hypothetical protein